MNVTIKQQSFNSSTTEDTMKFNNNVMIHHATEELAKLLRMNYVWGAESVMVEQESKTNLDYNMINTNDNNDNHITISIQGNAILSKCPLYDPVLIHDKSSVDAYTETSLSIKRNLIQNERKLILGKYGNSALLARTGHLSLDDTNSFRHENGLSVKRNSSKKKNNIVLASIHHLHAKTNRNRLWEYLYEHPLVQDVQYALPPRNQIGIILSGDTNKNLCPAVGIENIDGFRKFVTYPTDCFHSREDGGEFGKHSTVALCTNLPKYKRFKNLSYKPCYNNESDNDEAVTEHTNAEGFNSSIISSSNITLNKVNDKKATNTIQISKHGIIAMMLH